MARFRQRWNNFWFKPVPPDNLGISRIVFFGGLFVFYLWHGGFSAWAAVSRAFSEPLWLFARFHVPLISERPIAVLQMVWKLSLLLSCIGLFTRLSTTISFVLGFYLLAIPHSFAKTHYDDGILIFILLVMALTRSGDSCSIDQVIRKARQRNVRHCRC